MAYAFLYLIFSLLWYESIKLSDDKKCWYTLDLGLLFMNIRMFDFFIQGDALFVGIQINISHYWL